MAIELGGVLKVLLDLDAKQQAEVDGALRHFAKPWWLLEAEKDTARAAETVGWLRQSLGGVFANTPQRPLSQLAADAVYEAAEVAGEWSGELAPGSDLPLVAPTPLGAPGTEPPRPLAMAPAARSMARSIDADGGGGGAPLSSVSSDDSSSQLLDDTERRAVVSASSAGLSPEPSVLGSPSSGGFSSGGLSSEMKQLLPRPAAATPPPQFSLPIGGDAETPYRSPPTRAGAKPGSIAGGCPPSLDPRFTQAAPTPTHL